MKYIVRGAYRENGNFKKNYEKNFSNHHLYIKTTNKNLAFKWAKAHCENIDVRYHMPNECIIIMENGQFGLNM